jgi:hypothetical protein
MNSDMKNKENSIYQFKVTLKGSSPLIWRRVQVENSITLHRLSSIILETMGWSGGHLHQFYIGGKFYNVPYEEAGFTRTIDEREVKLSDLMKKEIKKFQYEYDMGDGWEHELILEKAIEPDKNVSYPACIDGKRACPPEDCGGIPGYEEFLKAILNPKHPEHESMLEWIGEAFDPEKFDINEVNESLKDIDSAESFFDELEEY